jgi:hypothetical protein
MRSGTRRKRADRRSHLGKQKHQGLNPGVVSGRPDLNRGPLRPERSALPSCATPRYGDSVLHVSPERSRLGFLFFHAFQLFLALVVTLCFSPVAAEPHVAPRPRVVAALVEEQPPTPRTLPHAI